MAHKLYAQPGNAAKRALEHRPANDESGEEYGASSFGGFGEYMRRKKLKLQNQDERIRHDIKDEPQIFKGMVIHINGYTKPPREDLHHLIVKHGGVYKQYLEGKTFITHIIASNLTPKKRVEFERYKVVRPEWIVDCVKAGKTLPWNQYRLVERSSQKTMGFSPTRVNSYKEVSSRSEKVIYGGGGLQNEPSQESSSYPTPPEMKSMDLDSIDHNVVAEERTLTLSEGKTDPMEMQGDELSSQHSPLQNSSSRFRKSPYQGPGAVQNPVSPINISKSFPSVETTFPNVLSVEDQLSPTPNYEGQNISNLKEIYQAEDNFTITADINTTTSLLPTEALSALKLQDRSVASKVVPSEDAAAISAAHNAAILANPSLRSSTVVNPDFIRSYFDQSRLHHLSAWKADLKNQMQQLTMQKPPRLRKQGPRWIMHVDFDCFFCSVSLVSRPELKEKPVCVGHGGGRSGEIASCNYPARKFGVHNGMSMQRALELTKDLVCLPYDFPAYERASRDFYDILLSINADAIQAVSVDEALLDVSSICLGPPEELARSIRDRVRKKTQCEVSIGIGENVLLAKLALRKAKPANQHYLRSDDALEFMENLDVGDLPGVGWRLSEKLEDIMNIHTIGELRTKSLSELKEKFGPKTGEKLYNSARGIDQTEVGEIVQRKSVSVDVTWGVRFETEEQVDKFLVSIATELSTRMGKESFKGTHFMLKVMRRAADAPLDPPKHLGHGKCDTFNRSVQLRVPTNDPAVLGKETITMMRSLRIPPAELRGIGLQMGKLEREFKTDGQKKLDFVQSTKVENPQEPSIIPQSHDSPGPVTIMPRTPVKATQFIAPTQVDAEVLSNLPDDIRARIISRQPMKLESSQIDEEVFRELPPSIQQEVREAYQKPVKKITPKKKKQSPRKVKSTMGVTGQSKLPLTLPDDLDASVLAELPSTIRQEVISNARREQAFVQASKARHQAWAAEKAVRDRKVNRTITIPNPPPKPTFQKVSELPDLRNLISMWFRELRDEGPAEEDVELMGGYLKKVVLVEKDLRKAEAVVKWFLWCCRETGPAMDEWWDAGQRLGDYVNDACMERGIGRIDFDIQSL